MNYQARVITITSKAQAETELLKTNCDFQGNRIMREKCLFKTIKLEHILAKEANLLKQTFLAKGGEVSIHKGCAGLSESHSDVLIAATLKQYHLALDQIRLQPWGLPTIAKAIESALKNEAEPIERYYNFGDMELKIEPYKTLVMGILNLTPDSFSDGGKFNNIESAISHMQEMVRHGANLIDIGAESTRPGFSQVSAEDEIKRLLPVLEELIPLCPVPISIDTYKAKVAEAALQAGAHIANDIWGLQGDAAMASVVAAAKKPVIIMHNQKDSIYTGDIMGALVEFFYESIDIGIKAGIDFSQFILDPGIGFGKTTDQNLEVMRRLEELKSLGCPILLGTSRKRFIGEVLDLSVEDRVEGTAATVAAGIFKGVHIVRVHDVLPIVRTAQMTNQLLRRD
ncbi:MAG: dihydropteroate synthase [Sporomusaceae bacterium]|nr:dihydropteroate synthase [Sporomusaceae bacterium]